MQFNLSPGHKEMLVAQRDQRGILGCIDFIERFKSANAQSRNTLLKSYLYRSVERNEFAHRSQYLADELKTGLAFSRAKDWLKLADYDNYLNLIAALEDNAFAAAPLAHLYAESMRFMWKDYVDCLRNASDSHKVPELVQLYCQSRGVAYHLGAEAIFASENSKIEPPSTILQPISDWEGWSGNTDLSSSRASSVLRKDGYCKLDFKLARSVALDVRDWASNQDCIITRDGLRPGQELKGKPPTGNDEEIQGNRYAVCADAIRQSRLIREIVEQPLFQNLASEYLGAPTTLLDVQCSWLFPFQDSCSSEAAQFYHWDIQTGLRWLKVFILLDDCDVDQGPHSAILGSHSPLAKPDCFYQRGYSRVSDEDIFQQYSKHEEMVFTGEAGTIFAGDTLAYHKGGQVRNGHRCILQLILGTSAYPSRCPAYLP